jgi:phosphoglycerate dehydrogenase-like enzyme
MPDGWVEALRAEAGAATIATPEDESAALAAAPDADGWIGGLTPALLAAAPKLRWLQVPNSGIDEAVFPELVESAVTLTNMRDIHGDHVANHALAMFLALCRDLPRFMRLQQAREWVQHVDFLDPAGMTVLIVGLGAIGGSLAARLAPFGSKILGIDPHVTGPLAGVERIAPPSDLGDLLPHADAVIVCAPLTPQTKGLFDEKAFRQMRSNAVFINVGRGPVVRLPALERALQKGWIAGAGLDVFETEPLPLESPLWTLDRVILTPHVAGRGYRGERRLAIMRENLRRFVNAEELLFVVDMKRGY